MSLARIRRQMTEALDRRKTDRAIVGFGCVPIDAVLDGGLSRGALHEIYASSATDRPAASAVALALAARAAGNKPLLWARQEAAGIDCGRPYAPGLSEIGVDPARIVFVRSRDGTELLRAGVEAARCAALGAVVIEPHGLPRQLDLTASRRLLLGAEASGVFTLLLAQGEPAASAASTRWLVTPAPSRPLEAGAPGHPRFRLRLLRQRGGLDQCEWCVEWNRDQACFQLRTEPAAAVRSEPLRHAAPLSGTVAAFPGDRQVAPPERQDIPRRRTG